MQIVAEWLTLKVPHRSLFLIGYIRIWFFYHIVIFLCSQVPFFKFKIVPEILQSELLPDGTFGFLTQKMDTNWYKNLITPISANNLTSLKHVYYIPSPLWVNSFHHWSTAFSSVYTPSLRDLFCYESFDLTSIHMAPKPS